MISVVVPMYNESDGIPLLYERLSKAAQSWGEDYELVWIDDGSQDETYALCQELAENDSHLRLIGFTRNFGHQAAVTAGLCYARGDIIAVMDADLQDPPEELHKFIDKCREGYDVVYAIRTRRKENLFKRLFYWAYYRFLASMADIDIPLDSGDFCVMSRPILDALNSLPERNRFIRGLRVWLGFRHIGLEYERQARAYGAPKYTLGKLVNLGLDGIINFSYRPMRLLTLVGVGIGLASCLLAVVVVAMYLGNWTVLGYNPHQATGWTSLIISILFLSGTQLFGLGVVGEYIGRIFDETKGRPMYLVGRQVGFEPGSTRLPGR
ncbi:MAG: glycosyltransferase family 2 protein [Candidatus Eremiobacteraeota bacterium]|nr:glycosyltransferase family 2 protein [Candidatus Eremiobacteraeota bacterium]MCW5869474.1 glycosyltransferase family 2 protein [Candidatus Eremiobacteraeota bacterium]